MTKHEFVAKALCPVNGSVDVYAVTVQTVFDVKVEDILAAAKIMEGERIFQEDFTRRLFSALSAFGVIVTTVGTHSGVRTTCQIPVCNWGR